MVPNTALINSLLSFFIGIIITVLISLFLISKKISKILVTLFYKSINDDIWRDVFDFKNGSNLKIYIRDEDYYVIGNLNTYEEKGDSSWFAVSGFAKYDKKTNKEYNNEKGFVGDQSTLYVIRLSDIEHIKVFN